MNGYEDKKVNKDQMNISGIYARDIFYEKRGR